MERLWQYAPGAVMSENGSIDVSGVDKDSYAVRFGGEIAFIPCEHFTNEAGPSVSFFLSQPIEFKNIDGARRATRDDLIRIRQLLEVAMPMMGRRPAFE